MSILFTQPIHEFFLSAAIGFLWLFHAGQRNVTTVLDGGVTQAILLEGKMGTEHTSDLIQVQDFYGEYLHASFED